MSTEIKSHTIEINGRRVYYSEAGEGEPTFLLHGGGPGASGMSNFRKNVDEMARGRRVIVPDAPGFGQSDNIDTDVEFFKSNALALIELMDAMGIASASLVGNSLGGATALHMALMVPDRVNRIVLMGSGGSLPIFSAQPTEGLRRILQFYEGGPSIEKMRGVVEGLVFDHSLITDELIAERYEVATRPDIVNRPPINRKNADPGKDLWSTPLTSIGHETLIIWGREDRVAPLDACFLLLKTIPNARLHVFPKCGHWAQWEKPLEFNELVIGFLDRSR